MKIKEIKTTLLSLLFFAFSVFGPLQTTQHNNPIHDRSLEEVAIDEPKAISTVYQMYKDDPWRLVEQKLIIETDTQCNQVTSQIIQLLGGATGVIPATVLAGSVLGGGALGYALTDEENNRSITAIEWALMGSALSSAAFLGLTLPIVTYSITKHYVERFITRKAFHEILAQWHQYKPLMPKEIAPIFESFTNGSTPTNQEIDDAVAKMRKTIFQKYPHEYPVTTESLSSKMCKWTIAGATVVGALGLAILAVSAIVYLKGQPYRDLALRRTNEILDDGIKGQLSRIRRHLRREAREED